MMTIEPDLPEVDPEPAPEERRGPQCLGDLLELMRPVEGDTRVSVEDVLKRVGDHSFPAVILVLAVILVSPVSGIPGTPTIGALITILVTLQALIGRKHLWLPRFLMRRNIKAKKMTRAVDWLSRPAGWMDHLSSGRLKILTSRPMRPLAYVVVILIAMSWPVLELLPFVTSFFAGAVAMIMYGLMTRDGLFLVAGYAQAGILTLILASIWSGLI